MEQQQRVVCVWATNLAFGGVHWVDVGRVRAGTLVTCVCGVRARSGRVVAEEGDDGERPGVVSDQQPPPRWIDDTVDGAAAGAWYPAEHTEGP